MTSPARRTSSTERCDYNLPWFELWETREGRGGGASAFLLVPSRLFSRGEMGYNRFQEEASFWTDAIAERALELPPGVQAQMRAVWRGLPLFSDADCRDALFLADEAVCTARYKTAVHSFVAAFFFACRLCVCRWRTYTFEFARRFRFAMIRLMLTRDTRFAVSLSHACVRSTIERERAAQLSFTGCNAVHF